ncbi:MAG TPA: ATP-binding protein [Spirochaetales bacterium]|nr:ATP-binding protein [Spirochaetales bacterium]
MNDYYEFLRRIFFFKDLSDQEILLVANACHEERHTSGDILFLEGSAADRCYIVLEGRVEVWKDYNEAKPSLLGVHGPGHFFGELALLDELPRSATVVARENARVLFLYREDFRNLIRDHSSIALSVMVSISFMLRSSNEVFLEDLKKRNTELESAYRELEEVHADRLRNERLSTLGKFSSMILHDIRNPLSMLKGLLQLMILNLHEPEKLEGHVRNALAETARLENLASEFLDYSRGEIRLNLGVTTAAWLFKRVEESVRERFRTSGLSVVTDCRLEDALLLDGERILRALLNVADNARKAMSPGGVLTLRAYPQQDANVFVLEDTGEGMSPEVLAHIFEPFYSSSKAGGTGLGMLIVKNVVEAHGGTVEVESEPGKGTRVRLSIPKRLSGY